MGKVKATFVFALAAAVLAGFPSATAPARAQAPPPPMGASAEMPGRMILVTGHGVAEAPADRATITVGVQTSRPTAQDAQERTSAAMNQIIGRITALGVPRERIRTVEVNLFAERKQPSGEISGYQAVQRISVTLDDLSLPGRVIDAATSAGANILDGVTFGLRDPAAFRDRALAAAIQDARAAATAAAAAAGVTLVRVVRLEEIEPGISPLPRMAMQAPAESATAVLPGTLTVAVQVRATYAF